MTDFYSESLDKNGWRGYGRAYTQAYERGLDGDIITDFIESLYGESYVGEAYESGRRKRLGYPSEEVFHND
ncbi:MAG TPA: hypothetical protein VJK51_05365 [Candidatus Nanoarchaeia archaeon]|nr:hypothetical protein [Candidatus Nanoarchaeia archaeon]